VMQACRNKCSKNVRLLRYVFVECKTVWLACENFHVAVRFTVTSSGRLQKAVLHFVSGCCYW
jgi:hypothetical protein